MIHLFYGVGWFHILLLCGFVSLFRDDATIHDTNIHDLGGGGLVGVACGGRGVWPFWGSL